jgi:hypothetical protein
MEESGFARYERRSAKRPGQLGSVRQAGHFKICPTTDAFQNLFAPLNKIECIAE